MLSLELDAGFEGALDCPFNRAVAISEDRVHDLRPDLSLRSWCRCRVESRIVMMVVVMMMMLFMMFLLMMLLMIMLLMMLMMPSNCDGDQMSRVASHVGNG